MDEQIPEKLKTVGIMYIVSGAINIFFAAGMGYFAWAMVGGICSAVITLGMCPFGVLCGFFSFLLIPLGIVEVVTGILALTNPDNVKSYIHYLPMAQIPSIVLGGVVACVIGAVSMSMLKDPEVVAFIEGP